MLTTQEAPPSESRQSGNTDARVAVLCATSLPCLGRLFEKFESSGYPACLVNASALEEREVRECVPLAQMVLVDVDSFGHKAFLLAEELLRERKLLVLLFSLRALNHCRQSLVGDATDAGEAEAGLVANCVKILCSGHSNSSAKRVESEWGIIAPNGMHVELSVHEFFFLKILHEAGEEPVSRAIISDALGREGRFTGNRLEALVSRLRRKLTSACPGWYPIRAVHGYGYAMRFEGASFSR